MTDQHIAFLEDRTGVMALSGPMSLVIQAWQGHTPNLSAAWQGAGFAFTCLEQVACHQDVLKKLPRARDLDLPPVPRAMVAAVLATEEPDLTPMAAVAGAIADAVASYLFDQGMDRVIVNNGGDIAICLAREDRVRVGIRTNIDTGRATLRVTLGPPGWGVNTSGLGGRSLTRGIASAATAFARTSSLADAAATAIANACFVQDPAVVQAPAQTLDPLTDIKGIPVTVSVGPLPAEKIALALDRARIKAEDYVNKGIIQGAVIAAGRQLVLTREFSCQVGSLESVSYNNKQEELV